MLSYNNDNNFIFFDQLKEKKFKFLYLLGSDNLELKKDNEFIVYQGSHGDRGAEMADIILPSAAYTEQNGLYSNLEGRIQECKKASYPIGDSLEDWKIFNLLLKKLGKIDRVNNFETLRKEVINSLVIFSQINDLPKKIINKSEKINSIFNSEVILIKKIDYYYTNSISRASKTMSECKQVIEKSLKTGTNN